MAQTGRAAAPGLRPVVGQEGRGGVEQHDVAHRAGLAGERGAHDAGVVLGVAAHEGVLVGPREAEVDRVEPALVDAALGHDPHGRVGRGGELVEPVAPVEDEPPHGAAGEHVGHDGRHALVGHAQGGGRRLRRVGEGPRKLNGVRMPSSRRGAAACRSAGW